MAKNKKKTDAPTIENRRARHDYFIEDTLEAGIVLMGSEVKAIRDGRCSIAEGYISIETTPKLRMVMHQTDIGQYQPSGALNHMPKRDRVLLAHKRELLKLARQVEQKGVTLIPLKLYFKEGKAKVLVGLARGKQSHDKRHSIAERDAQRDLQRAMSRKVMR
ncbi:MAG: SsrA-binding protein SmpB [Phycisphaerales bacterium]|nr:SsrA-binding protein SmpB [Planctomycetota bacterium]MCH8508652.1 SsrA-binding protein SmpB [Phycisphaerales bacterium]